MSDIKPKRPMRTSSASEIATGETMPAANTPIVTPEPSASKETTPAISVTPFATVSAAGVASAGRVDAPAEGAWCALAEAQAAFVRFFEEAAVEMNGISRSGFSAASNAAIALLGARTLAEAVEINAGLAQRGVDALIEGSAKLSEISMQAVTAASRPLFSRRAGGSR